MKRWFKYARVGEVEKLTFLGLPLYERVGHIVQFFGFLQFVRE